MTASRWWALALLLCAFGAAAAGDRARLEPQWRAMDGDGDGVVALGEVPASLRALLARSDFDGDGRLSLDEYVAFDRDPGAAARMPLPANVECVPDIPYAGSEDPRQQLDLYRPRERAVEGPLPVIAYIHGGAWRMGSRAMARMQVAPHVASGRYAAVAIGYRLAWQAPWPAQIHDLKAGIRWIRAHAAEHGLDPERICVMGASAGGHLAAAVATTNGVAAVEGTLGPHREQSSAVQCSVDFFGPVDLTSFAQRHTADARTALTMLLGGTPDERAERAREASPLYQIDAGDPPFLIVHGTRDPRVPYAGSVAFEAALRAAGVPVLLQTVEGGGHGDFFGPEITRRVRAFLERSLYDPTVVVPDEPIRFEPGGGGA